MVPDYRITVALVRTRTAVNRDSFRVEMVVERGAKCVGDQSARLIGRVASSVNLAEVTVRHTCLTMRCSPWQRSWRLVVTAGVSAHETQR